MALATFEGKVAVVTGGASGIGRALAVQLLAAGASVCLADIDAAELARAESELRGRALPGRALCAVETDVANPESVGRLAMAAAKRLGAVDLLCANAGVVTAYGGAPDEMPLGDWRWLMDVNYFGVVHCLQAFLPPMRAKPTASHVLITASSSGVLPTANRAAYCASKHAVVGLAESLYLQLKPTPIGVSLLVPGVTATKLIEADRNRAPGAPGRPLNPKLLAQAKPPEYVAQRALAGVRSGMFWILTHEDCASAVRARAAAMADGTAPPDAYH
jgi:NAD(P)-dependent dehydrogenase (short-subunit alcohol dehydrogenase family)